MLSYGRVPLPPSIYLLLSGLASLFLVTRRGAWASPESASPDVTA